MSEKKLFNVRKIEPDELAKLDPTKCADTVRADVEPEVEGQWPYIGSAICPFCGTYLNVPRNTEPFTFWHRCVVCGGAFWTIG